ncbi:MAG: 4Fe-4S binding protein [Candidatus Helarchaeota archaeon]|nr:4Fe-4S binding protein [Candidatus Helarchaeota archaeon]
MSEDIVYRELQQHLDNMPVGFPATKSGIEIRILKHLFTPEEAKIATRLKFSPKPSEPLESIYERVKDLGISIEELEKILDGMVEKGTIHYKKEGDKKLYNNMLFAIGIYELQLDRLSKEFMEDFYKYAFEGYGLALFRTRTPQLRTIPLEESISPGNYVGNYDNLKEMIENTEGPISVQTCICRQATEIVGRPCKVTSRKETCFSFGDYAQMRIDLGSSRLVSKEEALKIIRQNEEDGLVLQPTNSLELEYMCNCCACCCGLLSGMSLLPKPAEYFATNYYAEIDPELCSGCATCMDRCQMQALKIVDDISTVNRDRCIGCGLCVPTCPSEAIQLQVKDKEVAPPATMDELYAKIMDEKTKIIKEEEEKREKRRKRREERKMKATMK